MCLNIEGIRPPVISVASFDALDELRRFRHVFRNAYRVQLDTQRLALVQAQARRLANSYKADVAQFIAFLDNLTTTEPYQ